MGKKEKTRQSSVCSRREDASKPNELELEGGKKNSHHELSIISDGSEEVVRLVVPRDILQRSIMNRRKRQLVERRARERGREHESTHLDYRSVTPVDVERIERVVGFRVPVDVPIGRTKAKRKRESDQLEEKKRRRGERERVRAHQWQTVVSSEALNTCPDLTGFQLSP